MATIATVSTVLEILDHIVKPVGIRGVCGDQGLVSGKNDILLHDCIDRKLHKVSPQLGGCPHGRTSRLDPKEKVEPEIFHEIDIPGSDIDHE